LSPVPAPLPPRPGARRPRPIPRSAPFAAALALLLVLAACGGGDDDDAAPPASDTTAVADTGDTGDTGDTSPTSADATTTSTAAPPVVTLQVVAAGPVSPFDDATVDPAVQQAIVGTVTRYVQQANADPLFSGEAPVGLDALFEQTALIQALGADAPALIDRGPSPATGGVRVTTANCSVSVLIGLMGVAQLATADIHVVLEATTADGTVHIERTGAFTLAPGADGTWRIEGYDITVDREGAGVTDAAATTGTTAPAGAATTTAGEAG
jgi:hypothetical protein